MPKNNELKSVLIIGSGAIVIGQACEFDYSGTQAAQSLREEGIEVILINDNPATIMTDSDVADKVYMLPLIPDSIETILKENKIDAVLPTVGGQTALNLCKTCDNIDLWEKHNVSIIGVDLQTIDITENRESFRNLMNELEINVPKSFCVSSFEEALDVIGSDDEKINYPVVIRPSFTLGGTGGGIARNYEELKTSISNGVSASPINEVLVEQALFSWKEYELELLRDNNNNVVIICTIENFDAMGVHTGDSITVSPAMTLSDTTFQKMRDMAIKMMKSLPNFAGGCNVQFAVNPENDDIIVIEINPRVSRSSALASKATGYPIAKIASKLAIGYNLDELKNPIVGKSAFFEPVLDYVVVKFPRWDFEKFKGSDTTLGLQMKSVGEVMAIGRNFNEALQKAICSLEINSDGLFSNKPSYMTGEELLEYVRTPKPDRIFMIKELMGFGVSINQICKATNIDKWFIHKIWEISCIENELKLFSIKDVPDFLLLKAKQNGFSDEHIAQIMKCKFDDVYTERKFRGIDRIFKMVDTCSAEFESSTPYFYSTFENKSICVTSQNESVSNSNKKKVIIIGSGPNRIGQGIEFDYSCVHGILAAKDLGWETIMINCNPETVSTDFNTADKLYFEPIYLENVLDIIENEKPDGVIVQLGGQTALKLAEELHSRGVNILGTSFENMDITEDRDKFYNILSKNQIPFPNYNLVKNIDDVHSLYGELNFPVLVRPSYVIGGQRMRVIHSFENLVGYCINLFKDFPNNSIIIDDFLDGGIEVEIDAISQGNYSHIIGIMQHEDAAGIHSGDSVAYLPPTDLTESIIDTIKRYTKTICKELQICGLINIQFVVKDDMVYVIEANPRASRTTPFISKAYNEQFIKIATGIILNEIFLNSYLLGVKNRKVIYGDYAVKIPVFSTHKFGIKQELGPEMTSTGEVIRFIKN